MNTEDALRHARDTIEQMPDATLQGKLAQFKADYSARDQREILRQQEELDAIELDEAAYWAGVKSEEEGDLREAVRWYQAAAVSDFPGASLKLAKILDRLASEYLDGPGTLTAQEAELVTRAVYWYVTAFAAGESDDETEIDDLIPRHDPFRKRPQRATLQPQRAAAVERAAPLGDDRCPIGGLRNLLKLEEADRREHCGSCQHCQSELHTMLPGLVPPPRLRVSPGT